MMRKFFCALLLAAGCFVLNAQQQVTIIGNAAKLKLDSYPLQVNTFEIGPQEKLSDEKTLRLCESLDNSKFVFFPGFPEVNAAKEIFSSAPVCESMRGVLARGGILYFGPCRWATLDNCPEAMWTFFTDMGVRFPTLKNYLDAVPGQSEKPVTGVLAAPYDKSFFNSPNPAGEFTAIRQFGDLTDTSFVPLIKSEDGKVIGAVQENVNGTGTIVFTYAYNIIRNTESAFIENILTHLYGPMRKVSRREQLKRETPDSAEEGAAVCCLGEPVEAELIVSKDGTAPKNPTRVRISGDRETMIVEFSCVSKSAPVANITDRDNNVWNDDCVELILADSLKTNARTYHFIVNTNNAVYDAQNGNFAWNCKNFKSTVVKNPEGFYVKMEIPVSEFHLDDVFRMNVGREQISDAEVTSWAKAPNGFLILPDMKPVSYAPGRTLSAGKTGSSGGKLFITQVPLFTRIYPDSTPRPEAKELKDIQITLPGNDLELVQIVFFNTTDENYVFRIEPELNSENGDIFTFHELSNWRAPTGEVFAEIETPLNTANLLSVPSCENKVLLLKAKTSRPAGKYDWSFTIVPVNVKMPSRKIKTTVHVLPLTLKKEELPAGYAFGPYKMTWSNPPGYLQHYWKQLREYNIDHVISSDPRKAITADEKGLVISDDHSLYIRDEAILADTVSGWVYGYGVVDTFRKKMKLAGIRKPFRDPEMLKLFEKWIANWADALKEVNADFTRFEVPMQDEPRTADIPDLLAAAEILKKYGFRLNSTLATWTTIEDIRQLASHLYRAIPFEPLITNRAIAPEAKLIFAENCRHIMPYLCSMSGDFSPLQGYFRFRGIRTFLAGGDGIAMWALNSWRGNEYRSEENRKVDGAFLIHHGDDRGFVPTLRLEAFREAIEDLYYLKMASKSDRPEVKSLITPEKLNEVMIKDDPAVTAAWHEELVRALAGIRGEKE
ncbi:MAG: DUF4091 domain-containing protein [Lentisphaeria bacterium]|nr:DUF4091 domain-containing protein [Lentisphaeria bacterium]